MVLGRIAYNTIAKNYIWSFRHQIFAELLEIQKAAECLLIYKVSDKDTTLYIDNQAAVISLPAH